MLRNIEKLGLAGYIFTFERLDVGPSQVKTCLSPVPSVTEVGMAALLPGWANFQVDYTAKGWQISPTESHDNLARRDKRLAWLTGQLGGTSAVYTLDEWLTGALDELEPEVNRLIVTSTTIDAIGEGAGMVALHTFEALLTRLEQGARRLLAAGGTTLHLVTNHGFFNTETVTAIISRWARLKSQSPCMRPL